MPAPVNLYSDTQTRPTAAMRRAMAEAEVGDEQRFDDPTVRALCERVAGLLGMEAAVFLPSGTMCNQIAVRLHIGGSGEAVFLHRSAHPLQFEAGGAAALSGAVLVPLDGPAGTFDGETLREALWAPGDRYAPRPRLVSIEQTTNVAGGRVWPLERVRDVLEVADGGGLAAHLDGARLMNAVTASGVPASEWAAGFDTAWIDFTKGLGAPVGAVLAGSADLIDEAWRHKQMMGGAMRQAGIVAAGCLHALDHHVERLADDHESASRLAEGLAGLGLDVVDPETNIVVFETADAPALVAALAERNVVMGALDDTTVRAVTHLDVGAPDVDAAVSAVAAILNAG